ncbi:hypothetical protein NQZ68_004905 [Dissostichus eleginoides]|nr:hypothetical protein NQZ68_004905 [Dissostichus eleginoides]
MEFRRGRGGSWKRGGRGGTDGESSGGEHRGRGRGGQTRGRGKRDHYRGRGRGGSGPSAELHPRDHDAGEYFQEEDNSKEVFSRRKLESNWDRYEASERQEPDDETPAQRGTDYHVLMESAASVVRALAPWGLNRLISVSVDISSPRGARTMEAQGFLIRAELEVSLHSGQIPR